MPNTKVFTVAQAERDSIKLFGIYMSRYAIHKEIERGRLQANCDMTGDKYRKCYITIEAINTWRDNITSSK